ncbi:sensor histidine kinase [Paenibacillus thalictri]|uniref:Sensor histidine kinase n=1 Tax=Paenibacillus thalictri TaxID=2527873 RepID=A0A4Q9DM24_9BACL|nr:sensor histidine kinase [Paenibacillus thalictri]TBL76345.1 sensor histidine kinase [Paenibacillus thalictri]
MPYQNRFFRKIVVLVFFLLLPVIAIYGYSYYTNVNVVKGEIQKSSMGQLNFFLSQVEANIAQLTLHSVTLTKDSGVRQIMSLDHIESFSSEVEVRKNIEDRLILFSTSSPWKNDISTYTPLSKATISTYPSLNYSMPALTPEMITRWTYHEKDEIHREDGFTWYTVDPPAARNNLESANLLIEVRFSTENMSSMLDQYMASRQGNPFFYSPEHAPIVGHKSDRQKMDLFMETMKQVHLGKTATQEPVKVAGENYIISYVPSASLGWYLVDFVPMEQALKPINKSRNVFVIVISILLIMGIAVSFVIYRNVQIPILQLINNVQKLKRGDYSARLQQKPKNEFFFLFNRFNEMAEQIQELIEKVYAEKLRSREATVKQLQSQINPHFLYNCLFYIVSMSRLGDHEAVEAMSTNLGDYFRYTTRVENQMATVKEELEFVEHYLIIQQLRLQIEYDIEVQSDMFELGIPRLLLQPLVENAIIHGIEPLEHMGHIAIRGEQDEEMAYLIVEDDGAGMSEADLRDLLRKCSEPLTEEMGCGLWNVHQRLVQLYGGDSGIRLSGSKLGGIRAVLAWRKEGGSDV